MTASRMFSGTLVLIPNPRNKSWNKRVNRILEDAMVDVSEAPILLSPTTYSNAANSGNREKRTKNIQSRLDNELDNEGVRKMRIVAKINPEIKSEAPDTSMGLCLSTSLVMSITPAANVKADSIASKSPNVKGIDNGKSKCEELLDTAATNPDKAMKTPASCLFRNFSFRNNHARINTTTVSRGPAKRPSLDAPTLVTESYHKNTAAARNAEPLSNNFHDLNTVIFLFKKNIRANSRRAPAMGMLIPPTRREDIPGISVRNSTIIDSKESSIA
jgi:hypothetical protein